MANSEHHVVLFPFMSKGHTIPLLHFARFLYRRNIFVTIFTTPANQPFISHSLSDTPSSIISLSFPQNIPEIPAGIESTDELPSMSLFPHLAAACKLMQPKFEKKLESLLPVDFIVSDGFLGWTLESAAKFQIPRFAFYGMSNYAVSISNVVGVNRVLHGLESDNELITVPSFPWIKITRNDFDEAFKEPEPADPLLEFIMEPINSTANSAGLIVNSFYELEPVFFDYWNKECKPKAWCVGPLCPVEPEGKSKSVEWLDQMLNRGEPVLYVAFGSQAEISEDQLKEIAIGLEESEVNFLWVIRKNEFLIEGFEERVKNRGIVVRNWVDQREILMHKSVEGFLSHCGWNSVLESICAGVPILAWPMMAEQPLNARMVVEEIKIGLRVETIDGSVKGFVNSEGLKKMVRELMVGEMGKVVRKRVAEVAVAAKNAVAEGGSSRNSLGSLIDETCIKKTVGQEPNNRK